MKTVTLMIVTAYGEIPVTFEILKAITDDIVLLWSQDRICRAKKIDTNKWVITNAIDLLDNSPMIFQSSRFIKEINPAEVITK